MQLCADATNSKNLNCDEDENRMPPISKLAPEILGRIFEFTVAPERDIYAVCPSSCAQAESLAKVCKSWRTTALNWPRMWYHIVDESPTDRALSQRRLRRSGITPLHVYSRIPPTSLFRGVCCDYPDRIQEVHFTIWATSLEKVFQALSSPMPNLEFLTLNDRMHVGWDRSPGVPLILGGNTSTLRALALRSVPFIPGNAFQGLANLRLEDVPSEVLTIGALLRLLRNCPRLETIELIDIEPSFSVGGTVTFKPLSDVYASGSTLSPVHLPRLRGLRMGYMSTEHMLAILALLTLPIQLVMRLDNLKHFPSARGTGASPRPSLIATPVSALYGVKRLIYLDVIHLDDTERKNLHFLSHGEDSGIWFHTSGTRLGNHYQDLHQLERVISQLDTRDIVNFRLSILPDTIPALRRTSLRSTLLKMPSLTRLLIKCSQTLPENPASMLLIWMDEVLAVRSSSSDGGAAEIPAPGLQYLGIQMRCSEPLEPRALEALVRMSASRQKSGHPFSLACNVSAMTHEDLAPVSAFVEHLEITDDPLFEINKDVPAMYMMKNDYWHMFRTDGMAGWNLPEQPDVRR
ncbi:hypothetical protein OH76DRAFT_1402818 [Lentinus brumalis]|uniref:F-box domain-containing protein n=1 Tax=Lentinus brumalis TaxID=2498619 RepID=A0A371DCT4_9APHY|nr:hypothetical protein OH76DRAFT_1402818 [Polyporus brumalis]